MTLSPANPPRWIVVACLAAGAILLASLLFALPGGTGVSAATLQDTAPPAEARDTSAAASTKTGGAKDDQRIDPGDALRVDWVLFREDIPWKTTYAWVGELLALRDDETFNATGYAPVALVAGETDPARPLESAIAAALVGRLPGEHFELALPDLFGADAEIERRTLARHWGPFPASATWTRAAFTERFGEPAPGRSVATNRLFNSTVVSLDAETVTLRSEAREGEAIALPYFHGVLRVSRADAENVAFRIEPFANVSFNMREGRTSFGLAPGQYFLEAQTEETLTYQYHPVWSPVLVGLDFRAVIDVHPHAPPRVG